MNIDFYNNDLSWAQDDTFEADCGCHNVRFYRNRCYNAHTGMSTQPFYGGERYAMESGSPTAYSTMDYNAYRRNESERLIKWQDHKGNIGRYQSIGELFAATGLEEHGMLADYEIFVKAGPPGKGKTCKPGDYDLRLKDRVNVIDAGIALPQITDGFAGKKPDLGCYELGQEPPHYGPRKF